MADFYPERARGERLEGGLPAPPRPDEDERWEYLADHMRAIRTSVAVLAIIAVCQVVAAALWFLAVAAEGS